MLLNDGYLILYFPFIVCFTAHILFTTHDSNNFLKTKIFFSWSFQGHLPLQFVSELFCESFPNVCHVRFEANNIVATEKTNIEVLKIIPLADPEYSISENHGY